VTFGRHGESIEIPHVISDMASEKRGWIAVSRAAERVLGLSGLFCLSLFLLIQWQHRANAQGAVQAFYSQRNDASSQEGFAASLQRAISGTDQSLWSTGRIEAFLGAPRGSNTAVAVLRVPRLSLEAPVFEGARERELDRGPGWIRGTADIGGQGNIGIAGHRDGFFRVLKDIEAGDTIELLGRDSLTRYQVTHTWVVEPGDVHVLDPTAEPAVTLVTCYPFYFVGHAPQRFIVRATAVGSF